MPKSLYLSPFGEICADNVGHEDIKQQNEQSRNIKSDNIKA